MKFYKPRFWDRREFSVWPYVFYPFSVIVNLINLLKFKYSKTEKFNIPIILIGNIYPASDLNLCLCF